MRICDTTLACLDTLNKIHSNLRAVRADFSEFYYPQNHNELKNLADDMERIIYKMTALVAEDIKFRAEIED